MLFDDRHLNKFPRDLSHRTFQFCVILCRTVILNRRFRHVSYSIVNNFKQTSTLKNVIILRKHFDLKIALMEKVIGLNTLSSHTKKKRKRKGKRVLGE